MDSRKERLPPLSLLPPVHLPPLISSPRGFLPPPGQFVAAPLTLPYPGTVSTLAYIIDPQHNVNTLATSYFTPMPMQPHPTAVTPEEPPKVLFPMSLAHKSSPTTSMTRSPDDITNETAVAAAEDLKRQQNRISQHRSRKRKSLRWKVLECKSVLLDRVLERLRYRREELIQTRYALYRLQESLDKDACSSSADVNITEHNLLEQISKEIGTDDDLSLDGIMPNTLKQDMLDMDEESKTCKRRKVSC